jgi:hypothetical protein
MPNYKESAVAGTKYQRACRVLIDNPLNGTPSIMFVEEEVVSSGEGQEITRIVSNLSAPFDPSGTFPGLDPETNLPVGRDITHGEVYALLYSLYMNLATQRDSAQARGGE